jgi:DNA-binding NarL/FixJ family response regulator
MIDVLLADDQGVVRAGLRTILESQPDMRVVGEAADGAEAVALTNALEPRVVMMDIRMSALDGIKATRRLTESATSARILVLTTYGLDQYVYEALRAGAAGFLLKTDPPDRIVDAVRIVDAGDALLFPETTRRLIERFLASPPPHAPRPAALSTLTERELEVLRQVARGLTNREIAASLFIGEGTVKTHVARILTKLGLRDRVQSSCTPTSTPSSSPARATHQHPPGSFHTPAASRQRGRGEG